MLTLSQLNHYDNIIIQCHDNPDADAIASGYALFRYFKLIGKHTHLIYSGRGKIEKPNLLLMLHNLNIGESLEYVAPADAQNYHNPSQDSILITVDCQYGAGNVTRIPCINKAIIDHHQIEVEDVSQSAILPKLGSCSTLCWKLISETPEAKELLSDSDISTALYYGLFTDTNFFSELFHPLDLDMKDSLVIRPSEITLFRNSNLSLDEFSIAANAMSQQEYDEEHRFAIVKAAPCDPNTLGYISDLLIQVDGVDTCIVFNEKSEGIKFSVRSCIKEAMANDIAEYIAKDIGSGGGHRDKSGGYIPKELFSKKYPSKSASEYFHNRLSRYFDNCEIVYCGTDASSAFTEQHTKQYTKKKTKVLYAKSTDILPAGTAFTIRTMEGDLDLISSEDVIILIGIKGEVYGTSLEKFNRSYECSDDSLPECSFEYSPTILDTSNDRQLTVLDYASVAYPRAGSYILAEELSHRVKIFTVWDAENYMRGYPGDYIASRPDDPNDQYVINKEIFEETYEKS